MYDTCSCVGNYLCGKEKRITFWLTLALKEIHFQSHKSKKVASTAEKLAKTII